MSCFKNWSQMYSKDGGSFVAFMRSLNSYVKSNKKSNCLNLKSFKLFWTVDQNCLLLSNRFITSSTLFILTAFSCLFFKVSSSKIANSLRPYKPYLLNKMYASIHSGLTSSGLSLTTFYIALYISSMYSFYSSFKSCLASCKNSISCLKLTIFSIAGDFSVWHKISVLIAVEWLPY